MSSEIGFTHGAFYRRTYALEKEGGPKTHSHKNSASSPHMVPIPTLFLAQTRRKMAYFRMKRL